MAMKGFLGGASNHAYRVGCQWLWVRSARTYRGGSARHCSEMVHWVVWQRHPTPGSARAPGGACAPVARGVRGEHRDEGWRELALPMPAAALILYIFNTRRIASGSPCTISCTWRRHLEPIALGERERISARISRLHFLLEDRHHASRPLVA
jgi:hypothetical protein